MISKNVIYFIPVCILTTALYSYNKKNEINFEKKPEKDFIDEKKALNSKVEDSKSKVEDSKSKVEDSNSKVDESESKSEVPKSKAEAHKSKAEDPKSKAEVPKSTEEGPNTLGEDPKSKAEGPNTLAEGYKSLAEDPKSKAEGFKSIVSVDNGNKLKILGFIDDRPFNNNLDGNDLMGMIEFAQTKTISPTDAIKLIPNRKALLIFTPQKDDQDYITSLKVIAYINGNEIGILDMKTPIDFPKSDQTPDSLNKHEVKYSTKSWSVQLPGSWMKNGLSLTFVNQRKQKGSLKAENLKFSPPTELFLTNFRLAMLSELQPKGEMEKNPHKFALDYFQTIPVAKLKVGTYQPLKISDKIVMPNGIIYDSNNLSSTTGDGHNGDMREEILKNLFGYGINKANSGISSSDSSSKDPQYFKQIQIHRGTGSYQNKSNVIHGWSGGSGLATLFEAEGNEFSHELGHNYELGYYPGGPENYYFNSNSGWGYNADKNKMISTLVWGKNLKDVEENGRVYPRPKWQGFSFNTDPMAGAEINGNISKFTQYTPFTTELIQKNLSTFDIITSDSPTGYKHWDDDLKEMIISASERPIPQQFEVPILTLIGLYDPKGVLPSHMYPGLYGNMGYIYDLQTSNMDKGCWLAITKSDNEIKAFKLNDKQLRDGMMNAYHVNLPTMNITYTKAEISCIINNQNRVLSSIDIAGPSQENENKLPLPVIISDVNDKEEKAFTDKYKKAFLSQFPDIGNNEIQNTDLIQKFADKILFYKKGSNNKYLGYYVFNMIDDKIQNNNSPIFKVFPFSETIFNSKIYSPKYSSHYFLAEDSKVSPTKRRWVNVTSGSVLKIKLTNNQNNSELKIKLKAFINSDEKLFDMESGIYADNFPAKEKLSIKFISVDNPEIIKSAGTYEGVLNLIAKSWYNDTINEPIQIKISSVDGVVSALQM